MRGGSICIESASCWTYNQQRVNQTRAKTQNLQIPAYLQFSAVIVAQNGFTAGTSSPLVFAMNRSSASFPSTTLHGQDCNSRDVPVQGGTGRHASRHLSGNKSWPTRELITLAFYLQLSYIGKDNTSYSHLGCL